MKIVILGAGQVGQTVAENLVSEANDITVVDTDAQRLRDLQDRLDLRGVLGNAAHPSVLRNAGIEDADLLIAVTQSDEINMVACKIGAEMFNVPTRIARIRSTEYLDNQSVLCDDYFAVNHTICPEQGLTEYIVKLVEFPEALQVLEFAGGKVSLIAVRAFEGGPLVGHPIADMRKHLPNLGARIAAIFRSDRPIMPEGDTVVEVGDEVFFLAASQNIRQVMRELRRMDKPVRRVMIAGGGNIGMRLARELERDYAVKIIEYDKRRCEVLSSQLGKTLVLQGDVTDEELLESENVEVMDLFISVTNDDENNIMSALLAKRMGARRVVALINRRAYVDLLQSGQIDIAIAPAQITIGSVLSHVRRGDVTKVHSLRRGAAEAIEAIVHGDKNSCRCVGRRLDEIEWPKGASVGAIVRGDQVLMGHHDTVIQSEDHLIVFMTNKKMMPQLEKLFQVGVGFF
ncbi:MAG: Trk system potassium transporter TrkA [Burkholderiales bacterium]